MTNLAPEEALHIYEARIKIDESYRDLGLLNLDKIIDKSQVKLGLGCLLSEGRKGAPKQMHAL